MSLAAIKAKVVPGTMVEVTNHYITREDHPCYGTRRAMVNRVTRSRFYYITMDTSKWYPVDWPKSSQVQRDDDGTIRLYGGGIAQAPDELFLTIRPIG